MKPFKVVSNFEVYDTIEELPEALQELMEHAVLARNKAYAPYSQFKVGAAVFLNNNKAPTNKPPIKNIGLAFKIKLNILA